METTWSCQSCALIVVDGHALRVSKSLPFPSETENNTCQFCSHTISRCSTGHVLIQSSRGAAHLLFQSVWLLSPGLSSQLLSAPASQGSDAQRPCCCLGSPDPPNEQLSYAVQIGRTASGATTYECTAATQGGCLRVRVPAFVRPLRACVTVALPPPHPTHHAPAQLFEEKRMSGLEGQLTDALQKLIAVRFGISLALDLR